MDLSLVRSGCELKAVGNRCTFVFLFKGGRKMLNAVKAGRKSDISYRLGGVAQ